MLGGGGAALAVARAVGLVRAASCLPGHVEWAVRTAPEAGAVAAAWLVVRGALEEDAAAGKEADPMVVVATSLVPVDAKGPRDHATAGGYNGTSFTPGPSRGGTRGLSGMRDAPEAPGGASEPRAAG